MPQPRISIHPVCLHGRHGLRSALAASAANKAGDYISALGSVKGKNDGRKCVFTLDPNNAFMA